MFTSRAEYRLSLRSDNADLRLTRKGFEAGVVSPERYFMLAEREASIQRSVDQLASFRMSVAQWASQGEVTFAQTGEAKGLRQKSAMEVLVMPNVDLTMVEGIMARESGPEGAKPNPAFEPTPAYVRDTVEAMSKYQKYLERHEREMENWRKNQDLRLPVDIEYSKDKFPSLSAEELEKLAKVRPRTFQEAGQVSGITPHSLVYLYHMVTRRRAGGATRSPAGQVPAGTASGGEGNAPSRGEAAAIHPDFVAGAEDPTHHFREVS